MVKKVLKKDIPPLLALIFVLVVGYFAIYFMNQVFARS